MFQNSRGRGQRAVIDALIAVASLTATVAIVMAIEPRAGAQLTHAMAPSTPAAASVAVHMRDETMSVARSFMEMTQMHAPLTAFVAVGAILMLFMLRAK